MVNSISNQPTTTKTSIFYINDVHSNIKGMGRLKTASDAFDQFVPTVKTDKLKFSAGDFALGSNLKLNKLAVAVQNSMGIMASADGNHECDSSRKDLVEILSEKKYKLLGLNVDIAQKDDSDKKLREKIVKSYIQEQNGTKYGVIGLLPFDMHAHVTDTNEYKSFNVKPIEQTIPVLQKEIENLQKQGVNKVVLLSHAGYTADVELAKSVDGLDVIVGGHTHDLIEGITEGKNLFYSKNTGEPTIITQAGKDGKFFGVLNLDFDNDGVIKTAQNNVTKTDAFSGSSIVKYLTGKFLGPTATVGEVRTATGPFKKRLSAENPNANVLTDAMRAGLKTDISFLNSANLRDEFEVGTITERDVKNLTPFSNKMCTLEVNEKDIIDTLKYGAASMKNVSGKPGLVQVSGLKYKVNKAGELLDVKVLDKDNKEKSIDVNNPNIFNKYTLAVDSFMVFGLGESNVLTKIKPTKVFEFDKDKLACDYIKELGKPLDIKADGRIEVVD